MGQVQLVSERSAPLPLSAAGNGDSVVPVLSPDGRFVLFSSVASDLLVNDDHQFELDVFLRDRASNTTVLVSANVSAMGGGNGHSVGNAVSADGRYVLFQSEASDLLPGDTNGVSDVFMQDLQSGTTHLVGVADDGGWANGASSEATMTPDGRWVAFVSAATNLVAGDTNNIPDLFVRDLVGGTTTWVTAGATGVNAVVSSPVITPDGRYVAFFSTARGLVPDVPATSRGEIYLCDLSDLSMTWVSSNAAATALALLNLPNAPSQQPSLSDDGRYVVFQTGWTNGTVAPPGSGVPATLVFRHDRADGSNTLLSTNGFPAWQDLTHRDEQELFRPRMTPDGSLVVFVEREVDGTNAFTSVRRWDQVSGTSQLVSADENGTWPPGSRSHAPVISQNGRFVTFLSDATNLVDAAVAPGMHLYRRDMQTGTIMLVDADGAGAGDEWDASPVMSVDGRYVAFGNTTGASALTGNSRHRNVFLWDALTETSELISERHAALPRLSGDGVSPLGQVSLSGDGVLVAFASFASDLVSDDFNGDADVFVRNLASGVTTLVSAGMDGKPPLAGGSHSPVIGGHGRYVFFVSTATNLVTGDTNQAGDIFRRDLWTATTTRVSVDSNGISLATGGAAWPVCSHDGRYAAFTCGPTLGDSTAKLFWRDLQSGATRQVSTAAHLNRPLSLSASGQRLAYFDDQARLYVWDANTLTHIYTNTAATLRSAAIAPTGDRILFQTSTQLFVRRFAFSTNQPLHPSRVQIKSQAQWSGDGRHVAFVTATNLVAGDNNATNDVYLHDLETGIVTLVSRNAGGTASANGPSDSPVMSADGRYIAFRSFATDIAPGVSRPPSLLVHDRLTGTNSLVATGGTPTGWTTWLARPALSASGGRTAFQSWDAGFATGDFNRAADAFAASLAFPPLDSDGDGIPDWWMLLHFGHATGQAGNQSRAEDDADGDGMTNREEYHAGTIPTDPDSVLSLQISGATSGHDAQLSWRAVPGRNYQVQSTTNLHSPVWMAAPGTLTVTGWQGGLLLQATNAQHYYRLQTTD